LREAETECVEPEIRHRVRLATKGDVVAARLARESIRPQLLERNSVSTRGDLRVDQLRDLHTQFLEAARRFPDLRLAAATERGNLPEWPIVPGRAPGETYLGLYQPEWRAILRTDGSILPCFDLLV